MRADLTLAVAQSPGDLCGPQDRLAWLETTLCRLDGKNVDLLVLPELFLTGYNVGSRVRDWGEPADGPAARRIAALARRHGLAILYGFAETDGAILYNSASCVGADGRRLCTHRKLVLPPGFEADHFTPGAAYSQFVLNGVTVAILICYDAEFPETFRHVAQAGAELVVVPTALATQWRVVAERVIPCRAFENGVYVCYANSCGGENGLDYLGHSCIVAPDGADLARAGAGEGVLVADLRKDRVAAAQARLPYLRDRQRLPRLSG